MTQKKREFSNPERNLLTHTGLLIFPAIFLLLFSIALTLAPIVRSHGIITDLNWGHWIGYAVWLIGFGVLHYHTHETTDQNGRLILALIALLSGWGLLTIFRLNPSLGIKQTIWLSIGIILVEIGLHIPNLLDFLRRYRYIWLGLGFLITSLTLFIGINPTGSGPKLWIGTDNFFLQPSEPLKLFLIIFLAAFFSDSSAIKTKSAIYILPSLIIGVLTAGILFSQRDLGTAIIFFLIFSAILISALQKKLLFWVLPLILGVIGVFGYFFIDIVKTRVDIWLDPWAYATTTAYQVVQSLIAIASGGMMGTGVGLGSPGLVPVVVSDFVFAAIGEEMGLLGTIILILSLLLISFYIFKIALQTSNLFHRYLAVGIASYLSAQSLLIIGGNLGFLPLTGVTLPLVSYGGSSLVTNLVCILMILKIQKDTPHKTPETLTTNPAIVALSAFISIAFIGLIITNTWIALGQRSDLINRPENPRWIIYDRWVKRGDILDQNGNGIAITLGESGNFTREVVHVPLSPVIGYSNPLYGQTNLEEAAYPYLRGLSGIGFSDVWWHQKLYNQPPPGLDLRLSIDLETQQLADDQLGDTKGAIVLLNATSGEIYAMASHPYYDPNQLEENWNKLINDPDAPLLNRATQGSYNLGTASSIILLPAFEANSIMELSDLSYSRRMDLSCLDYAREYQSQAKGIQFGCSRAIAELIKTTSPEQLLSKIDKLGLFQQTDLPLQIASPSIKPESITDLSTYLNTIDGLTVSPIQMALVSATITNDGRLPQPRLITSYQNNQGNWIAFTGKTEPQQAMDSAETLMLKSTLQAANEPYWFIVGRATSKDGTVNTWFIGGTMPEWRGTPLAVAIVLEEDNPQKALAIGSALLIKSTVD